MKGVEIIKQKPVHGDDRGEIFRERPAEPLREVLTVITKKGAVRGKHYHKGTHPSKNPERFLIVSGKISFHAKDLETGEEGTFVVGPVSEIRVYPNVYHHLEAIEDSVFIELKPEADDYEDVHRI